MKTNDQVPHIPKSPPLRTEETEAFYTDIPFQQGTRYREAFHKGKPIEHAGKPHHVLSVESAAGFDSCTITVRLCRTGP